MSFGLPIADAENPTPAMGVKQAEKRKKTSAKCIQLLEINLLHYYRHSDNFVHRDAVDQFV
jgi:hypothetical protein